jgi:hypothetical protein
LASPVALVSITDNAGNTYAEAGNALSVDGVAGSVADIWYAKNSSPGATILTITPNSVVTNGGAVIWEFSGVDPSAPLEQTAILNNQAATTAPSGAAVTTSGNSDVVISLAGVAGNATGIVTGNAFVNDSTLKLNGWAHLITSGGGTYAPQWNQSPAGTYLSSTAAFKAAGSVTLTSDNPLLAIPASVSVPTGGTAASFSATAAGSITSNQSAKIAATLGGSSQAATISLLAPVLISSVACSPTTLSSGGVSTCTATLTQAAPTGGSTVALSSNNPSLTVPTSITVAAGSTAATFGATAAASIASSQSATVTASLGSGSKTSTINLAATVLVSGVSCSLTSLNQGAVSSCMVTLTQAAPSGGSIVALSSNNASLSVPGSVTVVAGATTATFNATAAAAIAANQNVTISATLGVSSQNTAISLLAPVLVSSVTCSSTSLLQAATSSCTVTLTQPAPSGGTSVTLSSNNVLLTLPTSVTVPAGATSANFTALAALSVLSNQNAIITATLGGSSQTITIHLLTLLPISSLTCSPTTLGQNAISNCTVTLSQAAPSGGTTVALSSNNFFLSVPASVTVSAGTTTATFTAATAPFISANQTATVTATLSGASQTVTISLASPVTISGLTCASTTLSPNSASTCSVT